MNVESSLDQYGQTKYGAQQQQSYARPTARECEEQASQQLPPWIAYSAF